CSQLSCCHAGGGHLSSDRTFSNAPTLRAQIEISADLDGAARMLLLEGSADSIAHANHTLGWKCNSVETGHHGISVDDTLVHSRRPRTAEQHRLRSQPLPRFEEDASDIMR